MKKIVQLVVLANVVTTSAIAGQLVIYGEDNRHEVYEATEAHQLLAKSTASMISKHDIKLDSSKEGVAQLTQDTLTDWIQSGVKNKSVEIRKATDAGIGFCEGTRFADQPNPSTCSGFLIAPDLIVTAGHCVEIENVCEDFRWVFDFKLDKTTQQAGMDVKTKDIYKCKKVVSNALSTFLNLDYAVIQLDRAVTDRTPLEINNSTKVKNQQGILVIGNPSGLPTKVAPGANVRNNTHPFFFNANLDTFAGNSGSAVFNADTGTVEGILVRGEEDYVPNYEKMCIEANVCETDGCRGEDVSRMTQIPEVGIQKILYAAATSGNTNELKKILKNNFWVDFYTRDGQSALIKAAAAVQNESLKLLIAKGAAVNLRDVTGNTAVHLLAKTVTEEKADALATLVDAKASLEIKNKAGNTALLEATKALNLAGAKLLIASGANKDTVDRAGENGLFSFARKSDYNSVIALSDAGMNPLQNNKAGENALTLRNEQTDTLLLTAANNGDADSVVKLASIGADINATDVKGETAVYKMIQQRSVEGLKAVIAAGAKVIIKDNSGTTPLKLARKMKFKEGVKVIKAGRRLEKKIAKL